MGLTTLKDNAEFFDDPLMRELITDGNDGLDHIPENQQEGFFEASKSFAMQLQQLHDLKPFDKKRWKKRAYRGGLFDVDDIIDMTLLTGVKTLRERKKMRVNPDKPRVCLLVDVSSSMDTSSVKRATILLGIAFIELFGENFAESVSYGTIGGSVCRYFSKDECKTIQREILKTRFNTDTHFSPVLQEMETQGFYDTRITKYIFLITDGTPEIHGSNITVSASGGLPPHIPAQTLKDMETTIDYITNRWKNDDRVEYFWIQLGTNVDFLKWVISMGYCPSNSTECPWMTKDQWNMFINDPLYSYYLNQSNINAQNLGTIRYAWHLWSKFCLEQYARGDMFYMTVNDMKNNGIHTMMDYFKVKFLRKIKA
jgi:hypothetical protein